MYSTMLYDQALHAVEAGPRGTEGIQYTRNFILGLRLTAHTRRVYIGSSIYLSFNLTHKLHKVEGVSFRSISGVAVGVVGGERRTGLLPEQTGPIWFLVRCVEGVISLLRPFPLSRFTGYWPGIFSRRCQGLLGLCACVWETCVYEG